jgi:hypothetical protein
MVVAAWTARGVWGEAGAASVACTGVVLRRRVVTAAPMAQVELLWRVAFKRCMVKLP